MSASELARKAWKVPPDLRGQVHQILVEMDADLSSRKVREDRFSVSFDKRGGRLFLYFPETDTHIMVEGWSSRRTFTELLKAVIDSGRFERQMKLELEVPPGIEFAFDDDDLGRMAGALEQLYGHQIKAWLTWS